MPHLQYAIYGILRAPVTLRCGLIRFIWPRRRLVEVFVCVDKLTHYLAPADKGDAGAKVRTTA
jgi:hypothetical protein